MATNVTVKGVECVTNLAGKGAMSLATFLIATLKDQKKTQGRARMRAFHGKPTKVFVIKAKDISDTQLSYITNVGFGKGLLKCGSSIVPFVDNFPKDTKLYRLMSTKPGEIQEILV